MPTVQTGDVETDYEVRGDGPPIVFVHGALSDRSAAAGQLEAFGDDYAAVAYDLRGHGNTANPNHAPYSIDTLAADLHAFVTELGLVRPVICGVSMGGLIVQAYASRYPDELASLVLADTFSPAFLDRRDRIERSGLVTVTAGLVRLVGYDRAKGLVLRAVAGFHATDVDLSAIAVPTLVLYGEHEPSVIGRHAPVLAARIPDSTVRVVPDAGHASPWDTPEFFNGAIRAFLADRRPTEVE